MRKSSARRSNRAGGAVRYLQSSRPASRSSRRGRARYALAGYGEVVGYVEHDYDLSVSTQTGTKEIKLAFPCAVAGEECPTIEVQGASKIKAVAGAFQRYHLGGVTDPKKDASGEVVSARFNAKGRITMTATFLGDLESAAVKMTFTNFESLGMVTKTVAAAQLNARCSTTSADS